MKEIAKFYIEKIITAPEYLLNSPCRLTHLLFPAFHDLVLEVKTAYKQTYPEVKVICVETYRSNTLQEKYFKQGASKIRRDGMHHFGIASDMAFLVNGEITYNGDYKHLRSIARDKGIHLLGLWDQGHFQYIPVDQQTELRAVVNHEVKLFQKANGLVSDGIVGPKTIAKAKEVFK